MRVVTVSLIFVIEYTLLCGCRATPCLPITCPFLDHHLDALAELGAAPKLAAALMLLLELLLHFF